MQRLILFALLGSIFAGDLFAADPKLPPPQPANPLFKERPFGPQAPPTPEPTRKTNAFEEKKPIPRKWIISGVAAAALVAAAILYGSVRRWHSSNLFDRQYRFPAPDKVALRFGAQKNGGHMATAKFSAAPLAKDA